MMKYINKANFIKSSFMVMTSLLCSCTNNFDEINTKPYQPTEDMLEGDNYRAGAFFSQLQQFVIPIDVNSYQLAQNLTGDIYSGYMAAIGTWNSGINNSTYFFQDNWVNNPFNNVFVKTFGAWLDIKKVSQEKAPESFALAQILKIASLHRITDMQGPMPYSQVGAGEMTVPYDSQEDIYRLFFTELDEAIQILTDFVLRNPSSTPLKAYDLVYDGDFRKWIKFANSLRLRLAMRVVYADEELAKSNALKALTHSIGLIESNSENAFIKSVNGVIIKNPIKTIWDEYADVRMGASMESFLKGYNDPRLAAYFQQVSIGATSGYFGARSGVKITSKTPYLGLSSPAIDVNSPVMWLSAAEVAFLKAEAALRGWFTLESAENMYNNGIKLSFEQNGVTGYDSYIIDEVSTPAPYTSKVSSSHNANAVSSITIKWLENVNFENKLERIITQKWLAVYPNGQESWAEFRRTGYPKLFPVVNNLSNGTVDTQKQIRRIPFPPQEYINNLDHINDAVNKLGGPDNGGTSVWWDKKR